jgi:predicted nucleic acid-binding protein
MTTFALDSNIISYILQKQESVKNRLKAEMMAGNEIVIPPIVYYEIRRGLLVKGATAKAALFDELLNNLDVDSIDVSTLDIAAVEYARLKNAGHPIADADLLIGAYCIKKGFVLVTNNTKHFTIIDGLRVINWVDIP